MITGTVKDMALKGLSTVPNDYSCGDGELQVCHNMLNTGGGLEAVEMYNTISNTAAGYELVYVHHTATGDEYIYVKDGTLYYKNLSTNTYTGLGIAWTEGYQITNVGNMLIITNGEQTLNYVLWQGNSYKVLGSKIPELKLQFKLSMSTESEYEGETLMVDAKKVPSSESTTQRVVYGKIDKSSENDEVANSFNTVMGTVNKVVAQAKKENYFTNPFFVRYAYEMYDGSLVMHSTPILMLPSTTVNPAIYCNTPATGNITNNHGDLNYYYEIKYKYRLAKSKLLIALAERLNDLSNWSDLIMGVKVFVSSQIYPYDPDGDFLSFENSYRIRETDCYAIAYPSGIWWGGSSSNESTRPNDATKMTGIELFPSTGIFTGTNGPNGGVANLYLPELSGTSMEEKIRNTYNFYLFKTYSLTDITSMSVNSFKKIDAIKGILNGIETQEQMKDDYHTHDIITAKVLNTYNNRLNKANCKLIPFKDMPGEWLSCYSGQISTYDTGVYKYSAKIFIKENGVKIKIDVTEIELGCLTNYLFYPNPNAYLMQITRVLDRGNSGTYTSYASITLEKHPFLFGAYYWGVFEELPWSTSLSGDTTTTGDEYFSYPNYMYTSEVDNPFVFPAEGLNAVGTGRITTIKTATKAMSQGSAFGTNPLYVFCTDGIWALEVGSTGLFTAKQAVSREMLINNNPLAATQADNSVLFLSERGLMELVGGDTKLLSGALQESHHTFDVSSLPKWTEILGTFGTQDYLEADDFISYISGARIAFDYANYRIIVFRPYTADDAKSATAFVYDIGAGAWGTIRNRMKSVVEDGAQTYVNAYYDITVNANQTVKYIYACRFVQGGSTLFGDGKGFYVTRLMKLGAADTLKTIRTLVERSTTQTPRYMAMWGSRDMRNWALIGAVQGAKMPRISGTPWKYIIVAGWAQLSVNGDNISRLTMDVVGKYGNKLR